MSFNFDSVETMGTYYDTDWTPEPNALNGKNTSHFPSPEASGSHQTSSTTQTENCYLNIPAQGSNAYRWSSILLLTG